MIPYIIFYLIFLVGIIAERYKEPKNSVFIFLTLVFILSVGLRDKIGGYDVYIYTDVFNMDKNMLLKYPSFEIGYRIYNIAVKLIYDNVAFYFFMTALIGIGLQLYIIKKLAYLLYFSLFIFFCKFYLMSFVYMRQGMAMGIIWLAIPFLLKRKLIPYIAICTLAFFIHKSSIVFFPLYFLANAKFKTQHYFFIVLIGVIVSITPLSTALISLVGDNIDSRRTNFYTQASGSVNLLYLMEALVLSFLLFKFNVKLKAEKYGSLLANGLFFYILFTLLSLTNATFVRFTWYYMIFLVLTVPLFYKFMATQQLRSLFKTITILYFTAMFFRLMILYDSGDFMPYKTILDNTERHSIWEERYQ